MLFLRHWKPRPVIHSIKRIARYEYDCVVPVEDAAAGALFLFVPVAIVRFVEDAVPELALAVHEP